MQVRSPSGTSSPGTGSIDLPTGRLSPVSAASSISRVAATQIRPSAGIRLPASTSTTSPGTRFSASISMAWPSRRTRAIVFIICARALTLSSAFASCRSPITALKRVSPASTMDVPDVPGHDQVDHRSGQQHDLHEVAVLADERLEPGLRLARGQTIGAVRLQAGRRLPLGSARPPARPRTAERPRSPRCPRSAHPASGPLPTHTSRRPLVGPRWSSGPAGHHAQSSPSMGWRTSPATGESEVGPAVRERFGAGRGSACRPAGRAAPP